MAFDLFRKTMTQAVASGALRDGLIGEGVMIPGLDGDVPLVYADYVASGRALRQIEDFVASQILPYYANSHTEASFTGGVMTRMRREARAEIARLTGCGPDHRVIFAGSGAALAKLPTTKTSVDTTNIKGATCKKCMLSSRGIQAFAFEVMSNKVMKKPTIKLTKAPVALALFQNNPPKNTTTIGGAMYPNTVCKYLNSDSNLPI